MTNRPSIGSVMVVIIVVLALGVAGSITWYDDHFSSVGSVDGQSISKDEYRDRLAIETWRMDETEHRIRAAIAGGQLSDADGELLLQSLSTARRQLPASALERLIDTKLQAKLALEEGISATPADVDAQLLMEATTPEQRHAWVIEIAPELDPGAVTPTAAQKSAAKTVADAALRQLQDGKPWDDVARTPSLDAATAPDNGDLGWLRADSAQIDEPYLTAVFAVEANTLTAVIEGNDSVYRIGRVTEILPATVDSGYQTRLTEAGIDLNRYRRVVLADVIGKKLEAKIVAQVTGPGTQRHVREIYIKQAASGLGAEAIKVRHILFSPIMIPPAPRHWIRLAPPGRPRRSRLGPPIIGSRRTRSCSIRSRARRATKKALEGSRVAAASSRTSTAAAASTKRSRPRSWPLISRPAIFWSQLSRPLAGT